MEAKFSQLRNFYCGKSLDDKIGGFINACILRKLHDEGVDLPFNLVVVNAVQEEVGLFGAKIAANTIQPDVAIAIDVCHDTKNPADNGKSGTVVAGGGVVFGDAPSIHKNLLKMFKEIAKINDIPYQIVASGIGSGTNADSYAYPLGCPTGLIKMAMRYMHTTVETVHKEDVDKTIDLLYEVLATGFLENDLKY